MLSKFLLATSLSILLCSSSAYAETSTKLYHRVLVLGSAPPAWTERGSLDSVDGTLSFSPSSNYDEDIGLFVRSLSAPTSDRYIYQIALEATTASQVQHVSSVKLCHLLNMKAEHIVVHASAEGALYGLDFFVVPIPMNGACPKVASANAFQESGLNGLNRTVTIQTSVVPPAPMLRLPPPIDEEGQVIAPPVEKTLLQQYWMYGLAIVLLLLATSPEPEKDAAPAK